MRAISPASISIYDTGAGPKSQCRFTEAVFAPLLLRGKEANDPQSQAQRYENVEHRDGGSRVLQLSGRAEEEIMKLKQVPFWGSIPAVIDMSRSPLLVESAKKSAPRRMKLHHLLLQSFSFKKNEDSKNNDFRNLPPPISSFSGPYSSIQALDPETQYLMITMLS